MPGGGLLTPRRFLQLGLAFGGGNGFEQVHYLLEEAFVAGPSGREISYALLRGVEQAQHYETNPIFALLHEAIYMEGAASNWSAERVRAEFPEFSLERRSAALHRRDDLPVDVRGLRQSASAPAGRRTPGRH